MRILLAGLLLTLAATDGVAQGIPRDNCGVGSSPSDTLIRLDRVAAVVGDRPILCSDLRRQYESTLQQQGRPIPDSAKVAADLALVLNLFIDTEVLLFIAEREEVRIDADRMEQALDAMMQEVTAEAGGEARLIEALRAEGIPSLDAFRRLREESLRRENIPLMLLNKLRTEGKMPVAAVAEEDMLKALEQRRANIGRKPATMTFRQMFLPTRPTALSRERARSKADSLLVRLRAGESFDSLAKAHSSDRVTADSGGGDLGWQRRNKFVPEFERWVWGLQPGQLSPVVETTFGYHIIRVDRKQSAEVRARHILITPVIDSADFLQTKVLADSLARMLRAGAPFDSLAQKHGDPLTQGQRYIPNHPRDSLPAEYQAAFAGLKPGDVTEPFSIPDNRHAMPTWVVGILVADDPGGEYTEEELRNEVLAALQQAASVRAYLEKMRQQVYVRTFLE